MMARSRRVTLRNGIMLETPALIPGLSSMAMGPLDYPGGGMDEVSTVCSIVHSELLIHGWEDALLVSAYDVHHKLLADPITFTSDFRQSRYAQQRFLVIDSGWYEKNAMSGGIFFEQQGRPLVWDEHLYEQTIDNLDSDVSALVVSWDVPNPESYESQISLGQQFFAARRHLASTILLKPPGKERFHKFDQLSMRVASNLCYFDVIGVTEKELGDSILDRLVTLVNLRKLLDDASVDAPIHVFGGLDPLCTPLLFAAGGEIFDGLGWLRYTYRDGMPLYREAAPIVNSQMDRQRMHALTSAQLRNLDEIRILRGELMLFAHSNGDWSKLRTGEQYLRVVLERLQAELGGPYG